MCGGLCAFIYIMWAQEHVEAKIGPLGPLELDSCELSDVGAENRTWVFWKSSIYSKLLICASSSSLIFKAWSC